ncbi:MAG: hypothetical protein EBS19_14130, partial [Spirochaetia bacterium]|nr:hypothetical protein [Spirochaetia bacterium]
MFGHEKIIDKLKLEVIQNYPGLISLVLFGSVARNDHRPNSDIDILIISENLPNGRGNRIEFFTSLIKKKYEEILTQLSTTPNTIEITLGAPSSLISFLYEETSPGNNISGPTNFSTATHSITVNDATALTNAVTGKLTITYTLGTCTWTRVLDIYIDGDSKD